MKKVAIVFVLAVFVPSLVLAWLSVRSLRDQQFVLERQRSLLYQSVADALAKNVEDFLADQQQKFRAQVDALLADADPRAMARVFDERLRQRWPLAQVGFAVTLEGQILSPSPTSSPEARMFCADNGRFLGNREQAEVYWNPKLAGLNYNNTVNLTDNSQQPLPAQRAKQERNVMPQQQALNFANKGQSVEPQQASKLATSEAEFRQLIGDSNDGALARFLDDKLNVLLWYRSPRDPALVFGAKLGIAKLVEELKNTFTSFEPAYRDGICVAVLDDKARPVVISHTNFTANWKHPFVATEIGEALPHWEAAVYPLDPNELARSAQSVRLTISLLVVVLIIAIGVGGWLLVQDLNRQLTLARQKTDFVSNVSHELKTPLTSIRMFSELLAEGRVSDPQKQRSYLHIITAETARLTRLINNVLDFARLDRSEKKYNFAECDLVALTRDTTETYRPHLENNQFQFTCLLLAAPLPVRADADAVAQVIVNLLSNAEKYSNGQKQITLEMLRREGALPCAEVRVLDCGSGVPLGCEEKIFEKFYRAHDSLSSGIQGSGLGLTLARQIARAHGGDVVYEPREGGGSCFCLRLPLIQSAT
ncbi:MAG: HAMP domain-containing histidine kinase [Verrucomicrobia bacterium]|nr:MAG: HAMP domain-containing histidine kinase [Verrucomicrobiota bacterium]